MQSKLKQISLNAGAAYLSSAVNIVVSITFVPIALSYFGTTRYGILILINGILAYLMNTSFGLPQAVGVLGAHQINPYNIKKITKKAFYLLCVFSLFTIIFLFFISHWQLWEGILGQIQKDIINEFYNSIICATILFALSVPFASFASGFIASQKVYIERLYSMLNQASSLASVFITIWIASDLATFFLIRGILYLSIHIITTLHFLWFSRSLTKTNPEQELDIPLIKTGFRFFLIGIAASVVWSTDTFVINHFLGTDAIPPYAITFRLITFSFILFSGIGTALTPMMGKQMAEGNYVWIQQSYQNLISLSTILGGVIWIGAITCSETFIHLWVNDKGYDGFLTALVLGGYCYVSSFVFIHNALYSGLNLIDRGIQICWAEALANLFFSLMFVQIWGSTGVALGTFLGSLTTVFWLIPREIKIKTHNKIHFLYHASTKHFICVLTPFLLISMLIKWLIQNLFFLPIVAIPLILIYLYASYKVYPKEMTELLQFKKTWPFVEIQDTNEK